MTLDLLANLILLKFGLLMMYYVVVITIYFVWDDPDGIWTLKWIVIGFAVLWAANHVDEARKITGH